MKTKQNHHSTWMQMKAKSGMRCAAKRCSRAIYIENAFGTGRGYCNAHYRRLGTRGRLDEEICLRARRSSGPYKTRQPKTPASTDDVTVTVSASKLRAARGARKAYEAVLQVIARDVAEQLARSS